MDWPEGGRLPPELDDSILDEPAARATRADGAAQAIHLSDASAAAAKLPPLHLDTADGQRVLAALAAPYAPRALGPSAAIDAIASWQTGAGRPTEAADIMVTSSTSEALGLLFKWAGRPGERVAHMQPGYPLAAHLAELEGLCPVPIASHFGAGRWQLDLDALAHTLERGTRIVLITDPNNPTGASLSCEERASIAELCNRYRALCIVDEVFLPYRHRFCALQHAPPILSDATIRLGGLSKAALLPQLKIGWLTLGGSKAFRARARIALTWLGDAYLSISEPSAALVPSVCRQMEARQALVRARLSANWRWLAAHLAASRLGQLWPVDAGFVAPVSLTEGALANLPPAVHLDEGALYDLPRSISAVASLILPVATLEAGWRAVAAACRSHSARCP